MRLQKGFVQAQGVILWVAGRRGRGGALWRQGWDKGLEPAPCPTPYYTQAEEQGKDRLLRRRVEGGLGGGSD